MFKKSRSTPTSSKDYLDTLEFLSLEVEELEQQIEQMNGHHIELLDRRTAEPERRVILERRKTWR